MKQEKRTWETGSVGVGEDEKFRRATRPVGQRLVRVCPGITAVRHRATLDCMPTAHPRHTITETPPVRAALDGLRARLDGERIDFAELVVLGAGVKVRQLPDDVAAASQAARRLAAMVRGRSIPVDVDAAVDAKHLGLIAD